MSVILNEVNNYVITRNEMNNYVITRNEVTW